MTTSIAQLGNWFVTEEGKVLAFLQSEEAEVMAYMKPLVDQIVAAAKAIGKETFTEGLQVLKDSAAAAVQAGAPDILTGNVAGAETAAEQAFLATGASEGITAIKNAEAATIKAAVAIAQTDTVTGD